MNAENSQEKTEKLKNFGIAFLNFFRKHKRLTNFFIFIVSMFLLKKTYGFLFNHGGVLILTAGFVFALVAFYTLIGKKSKTSRRVSDFAYGGFAFFRWGLLLLLITFAVAKNILEKGVSEDELDIYWIYGIFLFLDTIYLLNYNYGTIIDVEQNKLTFPAKSKIRSFGDFIKLRWLLGFLWRRSIKITDIERIQFEQISHRKHHTDWTKNICTRDTYALNLAGKFGSLYIPYSSVQKCVESKSNLEYACNKLGHVIMVENFIY